MSKHDRQSFLGATSEQDLKRAKVGIIGLGGGGSHVVQQLAHLGVGNYVLVDPDIIDETNLNRLVGGTLDDVKRKTLKVHIAERVIRAVVAEANIGAHSKQWQEVSKDLQTCDVLIGCLDAVAAKDQLDKFCQRFLIPYIDIGMDVHKVGAGFLISGQVVLITPGSPCLRCMGLVTDEALAQEARNYGAAGGKPQVVWPNGVLASTAVGLFTQLISLGMPAPVRLRSLSTTATKAPSRQARASPLYRAALARTTFRKRLETHSLTSGRRPS